MLVEELVVDDVLVRRAILIVGRAIEDLPGDGRLGGLLHDLVLARRKGNLG